MGYNYSVGEAAALGLGIFMIVLYAFALLLLTAQYVLNGIAMLRMAKKLGVPNGWMGFVPFADIYLLGKIADAGAVKKVNTKRLLITYIIYFATAMLYIFAAAVYGFTMASEDFMPFGVLLFLGTALLFMAAAIVVSVFLYMAYYRICENFGGANAVGWFLGMLLGSLFCSSLVPVILLLILSGKTPAKTQVPTAAYAAPTPPPSDNVFQ